VKDQFELNKKMEPVIRKVTKHTHLNDLFSNVIWCLWHGKRVLISALSDRFNMVKSFLKKCEAIDLGAVEMIVCQKGHALRFTLTPNKPQQFYHDIKELVKGDAKKAKLTF
jgi:hypothetical protein